MKRTSVLCLALVICLGISVSFAYAQPKGNGNAYGLLKQIDRDTKVKKHDAVVVPTPVPAPVAPVPNDLWEYVTFYEGPLAINPDGLVKPLFKEVKTGYLGYARVNTLSSGCSYGYGSDSVYYMFSPVFDFHIGAGCLSYSYASEEHRVVNSYPGFTKVTVNGVSYPYESAEGQALLATPDVRWQVAYRENYDLNCTDGIYWYNGIRCNAWNALEYTPAP